MNANELMIGNYLHNFLGVPFQANICTLEALSSKSIPFGLPQPIPITPEWLQKLGFHWNNDLKLFVMDKSKITCEWGEYKGAVNSFVYFWCRKSTFGVEVSNEHGQTADMFLPKIKHVHQLQNLYFLLTGEPLTIQQNEAK